MVIQILVDTTQPLAGTATTEHGGSVPFTGWLELLRTISGLIGEERDRPGVACSTVTDGERAVWPEGGL